MIGLPLWIANIYWRLTFLGYTSRAARFNAFAIVSGFLIGTGPLFLLFAHASETWKLVLAWLIGALATSWVVVAVLSARYRPKNSAAFRVFAVAYEALFAVGTFTIGYLVLGLRDATTGMLTHELSTAAYFSIVTLTTV